MKKAAEKGILHHGHQPDDLGDDIRMKVNGTEC